MFDHELSVAQERHDIHLDVLRQEMTAICIRMETIAEGNEREKESLIGDYEERFPIFLQTQTTKLEYHLQNLY
jgi:hypothetical protein